MLKRIAALCLALLMVLGCVGCKAKETNNAQVKEDPIFTKYKDKITTYSNHEFEISAFWAPYDISVEGLQMYKDAGLNTLALINHSLDWDSDHQFYLGSNRTMTALKNAKKVGLDVIISYGDWIGGAIEGEGYYGETPFSKHDIYGDYKDIIVGINMCDEPKIGHMEIYSNDTLINDFKKVYPNAKYSLNLIPEYAGADAYEYDSYDAMWEMYCQNIASKFEKNRAASIDFYYFYRRDDGKRKTGLLKNFNTYANYAKKYNMSQTFIMQSSVSPVENNGLKEYEGNEFVTSLSEADMRLQVNMAIAFGADGLQYYCYSVPKVGDTQMYQNCILSRDNTPSDLYYYVQKVNSEAQAMADVILSYDWQEATAVGGQVLSRNIAEVTEMSQNELDTEYYVGAYPTGDLVISRFAGDKGEAFMLVNFTERDIDNTVELTMKNCKALALYGGNGFTGTPKVVELDNNGKCTLELAYGEGVFAVPLV